MIIVTRDPLRFGQTKNAVLGIQDVFREINNQLVPDDMLLSTPPKDMLFRAEMLTSVNDDPIRVLSLESDGGGVRGIAALMHLDAVMKKAAPGKKPCEIFDMIGGTSTGGLIAIMLGRLQMSVEDCLGEYKNFVDIVFPTSRYTTVSLLATGSKWDATALEDCIKKLVKKQLQQDPDKVLLLDDKSAETCKVFVTATRRTGGNNSAPVLLRSYTNGLEVPDMPGIKLWEAARATSAAPMYFAPLKVQGQEFLDGGLQANNPLGWLWNEVLSVFGPARSTSCFLSIGTGLPASETLPDVRNIKGFAGALAGITANTDITNILFRTLINAFAPKPMGKKYWRFNVGDDLPDWVEEGDKWVWKNLADRAPGNGGEMDDVNSIGLVEKMATDYIGLKGAQETIAECSVALKR
ncbi:hypothetical protein Daus18300_010265 [Diaporthe australafricana]|uniref:PNPLA domain-containing protein n=1 Tax=Diaporthe australafricana TaxID=127596 RepID=A0ABR3WBT8_9PEZI